eukprot:TRINITY_DN7429_c0_g1_i1.p1 TRINITY_DN7429_c0_g1~~TRINITY_DN7429_c0_g1_i1.p1  ORF type:complete len:627 (+),score=110.07 TRINITY_DN7429_c0_g1_i1:62-1882(+)
MVSKKKKGPDPAAILAEQTKIQDLTREYYLKAYRREHAKSAGHRNAHKDKGKVPGFDPQPYPDIDTDKLDRLILRRTHRASWEDPEEESGTTIMVNEDPDGVSLQEHLRSAQHDVNEHLYHIMSGVDGVNGRTDLEASEAEITRIDEIVDSDIICNRDLSDAKHQIFIRASESADMIDTLQSLWQMRKCGLMEELSRNLDITMGKLSLLTTSIACRYMSANPCRSHLDLLCMFLLTTDPVCLDVLLGYAPSSPPDGYAAVSPNISKIVTEALRERDLRVMSLWTNFICVLSATSMRLSQDKTGRTLYCGFKTTTPDLASVLKSARADDIIYWPCLTSASLDMDLFVSDDHACVFIIRGAKSGIDLTQCSLNPQQMEIVLPPFSTFKVRGRLDSRKLELEQIGSAMDDFSELSEATKGNWNTFCQEVRAHSRSNVNVSRMLQKYQLAQRRTAKHKATLQQISHIIIQAEVEHEAAQQMAADRGRGNMSKNATAQKPEDPQTILDAQKVGVLDNHLQWIRKEQGKLERELRVLQEVIKSGDDELKRAELEGHDSTETDVRLLLKLQTEHYNEMVTMYDSKSKGSDDLLARINALRPADNKGKRSGKKR